MQHLSGIDRWHTLHDLHIPKKSLALLRDIGTMSGVGKVAFGSATAVQPSKGMGSETFDIPERATKAFVTSSPITGATSSENVSSQNSILDIRYHNQRLTP